MARDTTGEPADRTILHVDMNAFYPAVEVLLDPTLAGKPVIVGGQGGRGVVASCSYEARAYGVRSAMPSTQAQRLCPQAIWISGNYEAYTDYSKRIHEVFESFTPLVEGIALDEAFLDVTGARRLFGSGEEVGHALRRKVRDDTGLSCTVGVATTKFVAKLASEAAKPRASLSGTEPGRGVMVIEAGTELEFLHPLPVRALWGVGPATGKRLEALGVTTIGDLAELSKDVLMGAVGKAAGAHLHDLAWARDPRSVEPDREVKSIGHEQTYAHDLGDLDALRREAVRMGDAVATRMREAGVAGKTVTIKVRFHDFNTITRSKTLPAPIDEGVEISRVAKTLLELVDPSAGVRLFGVSVSQLSSSVQLSFGSGDERGWGPASSAIDEVRRRFGDGAVGPAALVTEEGLKVKRRGDTQWGPGSTVPRSDGDRR